MVDQEIAGVKADEQKQEAENLQRIRRRETDNFPKYS